MNHSDGSQVAAEAQPLHVPKIGGLQAVSLGVDRYGSKGATAGAWRVQHGITSKID